MKCKRCGKEAQINILAPFCESCFKIHYEKRVENLVRKYNLIRRGDKVLVAVSGGKDSLSCALVLSKLKDKIGFDMEILTMDVNTSCVKEDIKDIVENFSRKIGVKFNFISFKEYFNFDKKLEDWMMEKKVKRPVCSFCGLLKRYVMNKFARENGFTKIATGHCANDILRFFFKNLKSGNLDLISKLKPIIYSEHSKQVTKIRPLFECLEEENFYYAKLNGVEVVKSCSFYLTKDRTYKLVEDFLNLYKKDFIRFVRFLEKVEIRGDEKKLFECKICGEPTNREICSVCKLVGKSCYG